MDGSPRVLLLLPTSTYRARDFLEAAEKLGVEVVVGSEESSTMEPLQEDRLLTLDFSDPQSAARRVRAFHQTRPLAAVVPVDEETAVVAASIASAIGIPHNPPEAAMRARSKHRMREALSAHGVPSPEFRVVSSDPPALLASSLEYPVVLKPVFLSGSRGVMRCDGPEEFTSRFEALRRLLSTEEVRKRGGDEAGLILVERYIDGIEVALEGLLTNGTLATLAVFDKPDPLEGPFFEETIYVTPSRLPEEVQREISAVTQRAARAMGLRHGPLHAELRIGSAGPVVVEVAGRSIGGLCSRTLRFGLGVSLEELILRHALGLDVGKLSPEEGSSGVMMIPIPRGGRLEEVRGLEAARAVPGIVEVTITAHLGKTLVPLPEGSSYLGFLFARGSSPEEVESALRRAHSKIELEIR